MVGNPPGKQLDRGPRYQSTGIAYFAPVQFFPVLLRDANILPQNSPSLQHPTLAIRSPDEGGGFGRIGAAEVGGVPFDFLAQTEGDVAQMVGLGEPAGVF